MKRTLLVLFVAGACARAIVGVYQTIHGINPIPWLPFVQVWHDYYVGYGQELANLRQGLLPYSGFVYTYTPLFLYALYPFYLLGGISAAAIPIILADSATAPLVYLHVRGISGNKVAVVAGVAYALSPFMLIYEGYLWLSSQPMFFFTLLALYLLRQNKPIQSSFVFAIAVLFKQEALFILPVYVVWYLQRTRRSLMRGILVFLVTIMMVSIPFLVVSPVAYLHSISYIAGYVPSTSGLVHGSTSMNATTISGSTACFLLYTINQTTISSCPFGYITYSTVSVNSFAWLSYALNVLNWWSELIVVPLTVLVGLIFEKTMRKSDMLELGCSFATICLLVLFSLSVHGLFRYYYVPVYGLLLASSKKVSTVLVVTAVSILALLMPGGTFQTVLPLLAILVLLATKHDKIVPRIGERIGHEIVG